jgi:hypothetical protein
MKTNELTGAALDWAVAKCEYDNRRYNYGSPCFSPETKRVYETQGLQEIGVSFSPSTDWKQGGPIIEREKIALAPDIHHTKWSATLRGEAYIYWAQTPLIAAMRCYVASKLGDDVEIPEELK